MQKNSYNDLIKKRKNCKKCDGYGLCDDLNLSQSKGKLYQLETILKSRFAINSLGLWDPAINSNLLTASVLIIGQDFSNVAYFDSIDSLSQVTQIEFENTTNKKLLRYIELSGIKITEIYFTNAILCIKSGSMNAPIRKKWVTNCSNHFLKPLITQHLKNLKLIVTLGKIALDSVKEISNFSDNSSFSLLAGSSYNINIDNKLVKLHPMFHSGNLGAVNAAKANKKPEDLWKNIGFPSETKA